MKSVITGLFLLQSLVAQATPQSDQLSALIKQVGHRAPLEQKTTDSTTDLPELMIDINYLPGQRCVVQSTARVIERNLTLPYRQQTLYRSNPCQLNE